MYQQLGNIQHLVKMSHKLGCVATIIIPDAGHHQPLKIWVLCLYFMGLNLSNEQIAKELDLNKDDAHYMTSTLRSGVVEKKPEVTLDKEVECDEVYVVAGHKGHPEAVKKKP